MSSPPPTITIDGAQYEFDAFSDELREMVALYLHAKEMMAVARRQATIHEISVINLAATIKARAEAETNGRQSDTAAR
jgi:hypothetical protein